MPSDRRVRAAPIRMRSSISISVLSSIGVQIEIWRPSVSMMPNPSMLRGIFTIPSSTSIGMTSETQNITTEMSSTPTFGITLPTALAALMPHTIG